MLKHIALFSLLVMPLHATAARPESTGGKMLASIFRIAHRHSYLFTFPIAPIAYTYWLENRPYKDEFVPLFVAAAAWYVSGRLLKTTTKVIMDEYDIPPLVD